ncbi:MAG: hypothetical protein IJW19_00665 [Clostridia bacterium]|nr:hypothetical protein [Clostridia bacterium]
MKKIISMILVVLMLCASFVLTSCNLTSDPESEIEDAIEKVNDLEAFDATMVMAITMKMNGQSYSMPVTVDIKASDDEMYAFYEMNIIGEKMEMEIYSDYEYIYVLSEGQGIKTPFDKNSEYNYSANVENVLKPLPKEVLENVEVDEDDDGNKVFTVEIDSETFMEIYNENVESMGDDYASSVEDLNLSDAVVTIAINDDGYVAYYNLEYTMTLSVYGEDVEADVVTEITFNDPGEDVEIEPMDGYKNYRTVNS